MESSLAEVPSFLFRSGCVCEDTGCLQLLPAHDRVSRYNQQEPKVGRGTRGILQLQRLDLFDQWSVAEPNYVTNID